MDKRLVPLALATFAVGTDNFVIAGLLPAISGDLGVTVSAAGQLVTVFALTFAVSAALLGAATSGMNRRSALLLALSVFVLGNAATALGTDYGFVTAARILTAAGAGMITSAASSTAAAIVAPERRGRALAIVIGGLSTSTALGLPIGTLIGGADWRLTLWAVAGLGLLAGLGIAFGLPKISLPAATLGERLAPLKQPWVLGVLTVTMLTLAGTYLLYVYIAPVVANVTHGSVATLTVILLFWGVGTTAGTLFAGPLTDRYAPGHVLLVALTAAVLVLAVTPWATGTLATSLVWAAAWGVCGGIPLVPQQHRLVAHAPAASPVLLGLNSSAVYLGIAAGSGLGGLTLDAAAPERLGLPAAVLTALALALALVTLRRRRTSGTRADPARHRGQPGHAAVPASSAAEVSAADEETCHAR